jgi:hypothetical protein
METYPGDVPGRARTGAGRVAARDALAALEMPVFVIWGLADAVLPCPSPAALPASFAFNVLAGAGPYAARGSASEAVARILAQSGRRSKTGLRLRFCAIHEALYHVRKAASASLSPSNPACARTVLRQSLTNRALIQPAEAKAMTDHFQNRPRPTAGWRTSYATSRFHVGGPHRRGGRHARRRPCAAGTAGAGAASRSSTDIDPADDRFDFGHVDRACSRVCGWMRWRMCTWGATAGSIRFVRDTRLGRKVIISDTSDMADDSRCCRALHRRTGDRA